MTGIYDVLHVYISSLFTSLAGPDLIHPILSNIGYCYMSREYKWKEPTCSELIVQVMQAMLVLSVDMYKNTNWGHAHVNKVLWKYIWQHRAGGL